MLLKLPIKPKEYHGHHFVCIHGHFYQPPRENAWLDTILIQKSASPFHNWNERITHECYEANTIARVLDKQGRIAQVINNFEHISFNIGPTLMAWLERYQYSTYQRIIEADKKSASLYQFAGPAIAQVYNHIIMPLASSRDKSIQVRWGIKDFKMRFGRQPEGMWLAETAVDLESLDIMAAEGIQYTILAPWQAERWRHIGQSEWIQDIDSRYPYHCVLPSGNTIVIFFYDGHLAGEVAFGSLLKDGLAFKQALKSSFDQNTPDPQLVNIATDGETFGHHHRFGEMALAFCIKEVLLDPDISILPYGAFLQRFPPKREVEIRENTSWSCSHGVKRWFTHCGCSTGGQPEWHQKWRRPLRDAMDFLKRHFDTAYLQKMSELGLENIQDHILADYIDLVNHRSKSRMIQFAHTYHIQDRDSIVNFFRLLEMQRHSQLMYTSCAWFFNDVSGIETTQVLQYACRAIQLYELMFDINLEPPFLQILAQAQSNIEEEQNASEIYLKHVATQKLTLEQVGIHFAAHRAICQHESMQVLNYYYQEGSWNQKFVGHTIIVKGIFKVISLTTLNEVDLLTVLYYNSPLELHGFSTLLSESDQKNKVEVYEDIYQSLANNEIQIMKEKLKLSGLGSYFSFYDLLYDERTLILHQIFKNHQNRNIGDKGGFRLEDLMELKGYDHEIPLIYLSKIEAFLIEKLTLLLERPWSEQNDLDLSDCLDKMLFWKINPVHNELSLYLQDYLKRAVLLPKSSVLTNRWESIFRLMEKWHNLKFHLNTGPLVSKIFEILPQYKAIDPPPALIKLAALLNISLNEH